MCGLTFAKLGLWLVKAYPKASTTCRPNALGFLCPGISGEVCY